MTDAQKHMKYRCDIPCGDIQLCVLLVSVSYLRMYHARRVNVCGFRLVGVKWLVDEHKTFRIPQN